MLAEYIARTGGWPSAFCENLEVMSNYPPLAHTLAAGLGRLSGFTGTGLALTSVIACASIWLMLFRLVAMMTPMRSLAAILLLLIIATGVSFHISIVGREIVGNFFFAQIVGLAFAIAAASLITKLKSALVRSAVALVVVFISGWLFTMAAIQLAAMIAVFEVVRILQAARPSSGTVLWRGWIWHGVWKKVIGLAVVLASFSMAIILHPTFAWMLRISKHEGSISTGLDLLGFALLCGVGFVLVMSALGLHLARRLGALYGPMLIAVTGGLIGSGIAQLAANLAGFGSTYGILKHTFPVVTATAALVAALLAGLPWPRPGSRRASSSRGWLGALNRAANWAAPALPPVATLAVMMVVLPSDGRSLQLFRQLQDGAAQLTKEQLPPEAWGNSLMASSRLSLTENFAISIGNLGYGRAASWARLTGDKFVPSDAIFPAPSAVTFRDNPPEFVFSDLDRPLPPPACRAGLAEASRLVVSDVRCASEAGWTFRRIGWVNVALGADLEGGSIDFSMNGNWQMFVGSGWWHLSDGAFTWTDGDMATLDLAVPQSEAGAGLDFAVYPYLAPAISDRTVEVRAEGRSLARWRFDRSEWTERRVELPAELTGRPITIELHLGTVRSPRELGLSDDPRQLGLAVRTIAIDARMD
jgi:hypothetical protein